MKPLVTYEELQNDRLSKFEKDFNNRQQEFTSAMALPVPPTPDFNEKETFGGKNKKKQKKRKYKTRKNKKLIQKENINLIFIHEI